MGDFYCPHCSTKDPIPVSASQCPACQIGLVSPNVRLASDPQEVKALNARVRCAYKQLDARRCKAKGKAFAVRAAKSSAVICRAPGQILELVSNPSSIYSTFYNQINGQSRLPQNNLYDQKRAAVDAIMFPNFYNSIVFAALSLDGLGVVAYGTCSIVLNEEMFAHRASVFHGNSFEFIRDVKLKITDPLPRGFRGTWKRRGDLALAKLHERLVASTPASDFASILLRQRAPSMEDDFVEVHIFGGFARGAIDKIVYKRPVDKNDEHILKVLVAKARAACIAIEQK